MKLSKDEIEAVAAEMKAEFARSGDGFKEDMIRVLTRKFGDPKPVNPYAGMERETESRWFPNSCNQPGSKVDAAVLALVPELWAAAKALTDGRHSTDMGRLADGVSWEEAGKHLVNLRAILARIEAAPATETPDAT